MVDVNLWRENPPNNSNIDSFADISFERYLTIDLDVTQASMILNSSGQLLITGGIDRTISVWNTETGQLTQSWLVALSNKQRDVDQIHSLSLSSDETTLVTGGSLIKIWNFQTRQEIRTLKKGCWGLYTNLSPDNKILVTHDMSRLIVWDLQKGKKLRQRVDAKFIYGLIISSDSQILIGETSEKDKIKACNLKTGQEIFALDASGSIKINHLFISPDGNLIAGSGQEGFIVWDLLTTQRLKTFNKFSHVKFHHHLDNVGIIRFSPDSKTIFSAGSDDTIQIWDIYSGENVGSLKPQYRVNVFDCSKNFSTLVSHSIHEQKIEVWKAKSPLL